MITQIHKEVRLLRGTWILALFLAVVPVWFQDSHALDTPLWLLFFGFGVLILGWVPFGLEFNFRTFNLLLLQPQPRRRLFFVKVATAAVATLSAWLALYLSSQFRFAGAASTQPLEEWLWLAALVAVWAFSCGLWLSLTTQRVTGGGLSGYLAFFATAVAFSCFFILLQTAFNNPAPHALVKRASTAGVWMTLACSVAGLWYARWQFLHAEDCEGGGTQFRATISFSHLFARRGVTGRRLRPTEALIRKELQLHQLILFASVLAVCICVMAVLAYPNGGTRFQKALILVRGASTAFVCFIVPLLLGGAAVAMERRMGVMESFWHIPAGRLHQFVAKLGVVLILTFLFAAVIPCGLDAIAAARGVPQFFDGMAPGDKLATLSAVGSIVAAIFFFFSTLSVNAGQTVGAVQSVAGALICAVLLLGLPFGAISTKLGIYDDLGPLLGIVGGVTAPVVLLCLSYNNFKRPQIDESGSVFNAVVWLSLLLFIPVVSLGIYFKPWDLVSSSEGPHGAPRLNRLGRASILDSTSGLFVLLPDGRLWVAQAGRVNAQTTNELGERFWLATPETGTFIGGSNWIDVVEHQEAMNLFGIQSDGTLWKISATNLPEGVRIGMAGSRSDNGPVFHLTYRAERVGTDSDWTMLSHPFGAYLALKRDGSLWGWANDERPVRIGNDSDWAAVSDEYEHGYTAIKNDGSVWKWGVLQDPSETFTNKSKLAWQHYAAPMRWMAGGTNWVMLDDNYFRLLGLHEHGAMWTFGGLLGDPKLDTHGRDTEWERVENGRAFPEFKRKKRYERAAFEQNYGWKHYLSLNYYLSKYSDWLTQSVWDRWDRSRHWDLRSERGSGLPGTALAADGTLSHWDLSPGILGPSLRPVWSINILNNKP